MTERAVPDQPRSAGAGPQAVTAALASFASGVTLVMIADGRDDIGTTVSAFCPVSLDPPLVLVALMAESYPAEAVARPGGPAGFAVTLLAAAQRVLAGPVRGGRAAGGAAAARRRAAHPRPPFRRADRDRRPGRARLRNARA